MAAYSTRRCTAGATRLCTRADRQRPAALPLPCCHHALFCVSFPRCRPHFTGPPGRTSSLPAVVAYGTGRTSPVGCGPAERPAS